MEKCNNNKTLIFVEKCNMEKMTELMEYIKTHGGINLTFVEIKCGMPKRTIQKGRGVPERYYDTLREVLIKYYSYEGFRDEISEGETIVGDNTVKEEMSAPIEAVKTCEWYKEGVCERPEKKGCEYYGKCERINLRECEMRVNIMNKAVTIGAKDGGGVFRRVELADGMRVWLE